MGVFRTVGRGVKSLVNFPKWMGYKSLLNNGVSLKEAVKGLFVPKQPVYQEDFEEAVKRLGLNEQLLEERKQQFFKRSVIFFLITCALFLYAVYLLFISNWLGALLAFVVTFIALSFTFREHFWYVQIKQRRLGCTFKEYLQGFFQ